MNPAATPTDDTDLQAKTDRVVTAALDLQAEDVVAIDLRSLSAYADHFVILTGRSDRHVRSIADAIVHSLREAGQDPLGVEGHDEGHWVLIDANDVVVHLFDQDTRELFDLERLWSDAPRLRLPEVQAEAEAATDLPTTP
jgi:ribosome-associated protein